jgi:hypothetical protein
LDRTERNEAAGRLASLESLVRSDGWQLFLEMGRNIETMARQSMHGSHDAWAGAKHLGAFVAVGELITWPEREAETIRRMLESDE